MHHKMIKITMTVQTTHPDILYGIVDDMFTNDIFNTEILYSAESHPDTEEIWDEFQTRIFSYDLEKVNSPSCQEAGTHIDQVWDSERNIICAACGQLVMTQKELNS